MSPVKVAVIGGSGLYRLGLLENAEPVEVHTPYGSHSSGLTVGRLAGRKVAFLPRHGLGHRIPPHKIPYRANIWALRELGVERVVAVSAMGGLRPDYEIGDLVLPDQFIDWTRGRRATFFDGPQVVHTSMADPFCPKLRELLGEAAEGAGFRVHTQGTALTFEGPRFSTRAESRVFREVLGADLLSMTQVPEVVLARELGMCYATCAVVTDLDVWGTEPVRADEVTQVMREAEPKIAELLSRAVPAIPEVRGCDCAEAARAALGEDVKNRKEEHG
jgi:5'-methylthioadenosine phosphorylase